MIQKCLETIKNEKLEFIISEVIKNVNYLFSNRELKSINRSID